MTSCQEELDAAVALRKVRALESASKYLFFTGKSTFLQKKTALEALRDGLLTKVLMANRGFSKFLTGTIGVPPQLRKIKSAKNRPGNRSSF